LAGGRGPLCACAEGGLWLRPCVQGETKGCAFLKFHERQSAVGDTTLLMSRRLSSPVPSRCAWWRESSRDITCGLTPVGVCGVSCVRSRT
jgi:hypothetical protein